MKIETMIISLPRTALAMIFKLEGNQFYLNTDTFKISMLLSLHQSITYSVSEVKA